ncbi:MAG: ferritin [Candidatus Krumholzibacteriota bacterium]|nr:ferritin [Candidatus Krumholzibacteriota bacterium]
MLNKKIEKALNDQVAAEFYSAYLYLAMAAFLESLDLPGFANWMRVQYQEETAHGQILYNYIFERDGMVILQAIDAPPEEWKSVQDVFDEVYKHEQKVTALINNLVDLALSEKDHATYNFLQWFVKEQVEEEASAKAVQQQLRLLGDSKSGLFMVDREMGARIFNTPAPLLGQD